MKIIHNNFIPFKGFSAINLLGVIFIRSGHFVTPNVLTHEHIHTEQMKELLYVPFYIIYFIEWLYRLTRKGNAYRSISFEREAYENENNPQYLWNRKKYAMWRKHK